jgi:hypothetical protein
MSLVTVAEVQAATGSPLSTTDLQVIIDRTEDELTDLAGPYDASAMTENLKGGRESLMLKRPVTAVTSVTEYTLSDMVTGTVLAASKYYLFPDHGLLKRAGQVWGPLVKVIYTPQDQTALRKQVIIDLIRLDLARTGLKSESVAGEYSYTALDNFDSDRGRVARRLVFYEV